MSKKKVWWICSKGHEWKASVATRNKGTGCPYCTGQAVCSDNSLQTINPSLSRQWHSWKNGTLTPGNVTANSGRKVWWVCSNGHEWQAVVANRNRGRGCPYCAGEEGNPMTEKLDEKKLVSFEEPLRANVVTKSFL